MVGRIADAVVLMGLGAHPVSGPGVMRPFGFRSVGPQRRSASSFRAMNAAGFHCRRISIG